MGVGPDPFFSPSPSEPPPAVIAARIRLARRNQGDRPLLVSHGFGLGAGAPKNDDTGSSSMPSDALLALTPDDMRAIAEDLVAALLAQHPELVLKARSDQRWDAHLGLVIRDTWSDFQACVGNAPGAEEHFRAALNGILAEGRSVF
jgi:hypothetical protein